MKKYTLFSFVFVCILLFTLLGFNATASADNCAPGDVYHSGTGLRCGDANATNASTTPTISAFPSSGTLTKSAPALLVNFVVSNYSPVGGEMVDSGDGTKIPLAFLYRYGYHLPGTYIVKLLSANSTVIATTQVVVSAAPIVGSLIDWCQTITSPGTYKLTSNISASAQPWQPCIHIANVKDVTLDCNNFGITGIVSGAIKIANVENFTIQNCKLDASAESAGLVLDISNSKNGTIRDNTIGGEFSDVQQSSGLNISGNNFSSVYEQNHTSNSTISNNKFVLNLDRHEYTPSAMIVSGSGNHNKIINNTIDGKAPGILNVQVGADDGIVLEDEDSDLIQGNTIANAWDCGIENGGMISNSRIENNTMDNMGMCGIGGWYWSSWLGNTIANNTVNNTYELFHFTREYGLRPGDTGVYFKDNTFSNNKLLNGRVQRPNGWNYGSSMIFIDKPNKVSWSSPGEILPTQAQMITGNNKFQGNDFGTGLLLQLYPFSMFVDLGGNICRSSGDVNFPLSSCGAEWNRRITVIAPNGGETFPSGSKTRISWSNSSTVDRVEINIIGTGGSESFIAYVPASQGSYEWVVPNTLGSWKIRISNPDQSIISSPPDQSDSYFTITTPTPTKYTDSQIITYLEQAARNRPKSIFVGATATDFDVNNDKQVNSTDQILIRNILTATDSVFGVVYDRISQIVDSQIGRTKSESAFIDELDVDRNGTISTSDKTDILRAIKGNRVYSPSPTVSLPPTVSAPTGPSSVVAGTSNVWGFTAQKADDYVTGYEINWGDGTARVAPTQAFSTTTLTTSKSHTYATAGIYTITLTVADSRGDTASSTTIVNVTPAVVSSPSLPPTVSAPTGPSTVVAGTSNIWGFTATKADDYVTNYEINWGDGTANTTPAQAFSTGTMTTSKSHTYTTAGTYTIGLYVTDSRGDMGYKATTVNVTPAVVSAPSLPPTVSAPTGSSSVVVGTSNVWGFTAQRADDYVTGYEINWGDGTANTTPAQAFSTGTMTTSKSHTYATEGTYTITLTAIDSRGDRASNTTTVNVTAPLPPTVSAPTGSSSVVVGTSNVWGFTAQRADDYVTGYEINWGDGTANTTPAQAFSTATMTTAKSHTYTTEGTYTITLTAIDSKGDRASNTTTVNVTPATSSSRLKRTPGTGSLSANAIGANENNNSITGNIANSTQFYFTQFLEEGSYGNEVRDLQKFLEKTNYDVGKIDGIFGPKVKEAVIKFQTNNKLKVDGIVGYEVRTVLNR